MGSQRAGHNWVTFTFTNVKITRSFMPSIFFVKLWNNWKCSSKLQTLNCTFQCYLLMKYSLHYFLTWMYLDHLKYQRHQIYIQIWISCENNTVLLSKSLLSSFHGIVLNKLPTYKNFSFYWHNLSGITILELWSLFKSLQFSGETAWTVNHN